MSKKDKERYSRGDPDARYKVYWLAALNWIVPVTVILIGLIITTQRFAPLMNYDPYVIGDPLFVTKSGYRVYNPAIFILGMFKFAFNETYSYYFFKAAPPVFIALCLAVLLFLITSILTASHQKNQHIHGTADWMTTEDLAAVGHLQEHGVVCGELASADVSYRVDEEKQSMVLHLPEHLCCRLPRFLLKNSGEKFSFLETYLPLGYNPRIAPLICHSGRTNTWMIAPTRAGKGVSVIIPTLLSYGVPHWETVKNDNTGKKEKILKGQGSVVCFDPKGENWDATAGYRSIFSVCIPFRPLEENGDTAHYNPIHEIPDSASEAFSWADMIAEIFFGAENSKGGGGNDAAAYFNNTARDIFAGVVMHVRFDPAIDWKDKNMGKVLDIFSMADEKKPDDDGEGENTGAAMLAEMRDHMHYTDKGVPSPEIHKLIVDAANRSEKQVPKERSSTYTTVFSKISLFQDPLLRRATAYSDFSVDDFVEGKNPISLYLIVPYNHIKRISPVFRMIITFMIKKFSSGTTNATSVKLKIPCLFLLDEFPVLGYFPDIALNAGILAGYGVTFFIVSQSLNQIVDVYGENHPFLDHCKTIVIFAPGNFKDAKNFSDTFGQRSVLLDNISSSGNKYDGGFSNVSRSSQETATSLISPDELMRLEFNRCIVIIQGKGQYKGKKVVYYEDPRFRKKAWRVTPNLEAVNYRLNKLPSKRKKKYLLKSDEFIKRYEEAKIKIESVEVMDEIPNDFVLFPA